MTRRLPTIHGITEHDAGPWRMERLDLEFDTASADATSAFTAAATGP